MSTIELLAGHERRWIEKNLDDNDISFVVVGGVAVKFHCPERERNDVDLFIGADRDQIERLVREVRGFSEDAVPRLLSSKVGHAAVVSDGLKIDLFSFVPALDMSEALRTASHHEERGLSLPILSRDLLLRCKEAVSQSPDVEDRDLSDIELLRQAIARDG